MKIQVVGLGLMGGSLCKAIRRYTDHTVLGMDLDEKTLEKALEQGAIHEIGTAETLSEADLAIVCLYPEGTIRFLLDNGERFRKGGLVCDICGVNAHVP